MAELFRNCIAPHTIKNLAIAIKDVYSPFNETSFIQTIAPTLEPLSLTERLTLVTETLETYLPKDFKKSAEILVASLPEELDPNGDDPVATEYDSLQGFIIISLASYIARNGKEHFTLSMLTLKEMTKRFSAEGPIREFLISHKNQVLKLYKEWAKDDNVHVRRLVSESLRPRLPWTIRLNQFIDDPKPVIEILDMLKEDPCLYVRRSVANNLNDIAKDNPHVVIETLNKWNSVKTKEMKWLIKHALRTLEKQGLPEALEILGYSHEVDIEVSEFSIEKSQVHFGESLNFTLELKTNKKDTQKLLIDYIMYHMKANGTLTPKVFKWTKKSISSKAPLTLTKKHSIKPITTRKYYPGKHEIHIQINGKVFAKEVFNLVM